MIRADQNKNRRRSLLLAAFFVVLVLPAIFALWL
jgi:hypothetical protein